MKSTPSVSLLASTAIVLCAQFAYIAPSLSQDMPPVHSPADDLRRFYSAVDSGDVAGAQNYVSAVQNMLATDPRFQNYRVDMNFRDDAGNTPLIRAARQPNINMIKFLLDNGADINAENAKWETALITAYNSGNYTVARYLISQGAGDPYNVAARISDMETRMAADSTAGKMSASTKAALIGGGAALAIGGAVAAASAGGGGGGGGGAGSSGGTGGLSCSAGNSTHPANCPPGFYNTAEARNQEGILNMNTQFAYGHGYDGRIFDRNPDGTLIDDQPDGFVRVGVLDSGINLNHTDLDDNILTGLSVTCDETGCVSGGVDNVGHGTNVAGIIAAEVNNSGMHGVAPRAKLIALRFSDADGALTAGDATAIRYGLTQGVQVFNASYGLTSFNRDIPIVNAVDSLSTSYTAPPPSTIRAFLTQNIDGTNYEQEYQSLVDNHAIIVYSAGNSGLNQSNILGGLPAYFQGAVAPVYLTQTNYNIVNPSHLDWSNNWVTVVALDDDNQLASYSNQCGVSRDWCIAAPGNIALSTSMDGGYDADIQGTSFAAPNVTGAIAIMLGAFPHLTPEEVLAILFDTATDLGATGVDTIYGHGLVNLRAASDPSIGGWTLSSSSLSSSYSFYNSGFSLSAPFGDAMASSHAMLMFQDKYTKGYRVPLSALSGGMTQNKTAFDKFSQFAMAAYDNVARIGEHSTLAFSTTSTQPMAGYMLNNMKPENTTPGETKLAKFAYNSAIEMGQDKALFGFNYKTDLNDAVSDPNKRRLVVSDALKNPYLSLTDAATSAVIGMESGRHKWTLVNYQSKFDNEYNYRFDTKKSLSGFFGEYSVKKGKATVALSEGVAMEQNSLLGSETSGAFGIDKSTTYHAGLSGRYELADNVALIANYHMGMTKVDAANGSLFTDFDTLMTNAFAAGVEFSDVRQKGDTMGLLVSQPLRVASGSAGMMLPSYMAANGSVLYSQQSLNLSPSGRELDIEGYYGVKLSEKSELSLNAIFRANPNNNEDADSEAAMFGKYSYRF